MNVGQKISPWCSILSLIIKRCLVCSITWSYFLFFVSSLVDLALLIFKLVLLPLFPWSTRSLLPPRAFKSYGCGAEFLGTSYNKSIFYVCEERSRWTRLLLELWPWLDCSCFEFILKLFLLNLLFLLMDELVRCISSRQGWSSSCTTSELIKASFELGCPLFFAGETLADRIRFYLFKGLIVNDFFKLVSEISSIKASGLMKGFCGSSSAITINLKFWN